MNYDDDLDQELDQEEKQKLFKEDERKPLLEEELDYLETLLRFYGKIRQLNLTLADFVDEKNGRLLETNQQLLRDAALYTKDIDSRDELRAHFQAKEALLLWCQIYCQKVLMARYYHDDDTQELIRYKSIEFVMEGFEEIRKSINEHFKLPEEEREAKFRTVGECSVKSYLEHCASYALRREFNQKKKSNKHLVRISPAEAARLKDKKIWVKEQNGRFYTFPQFTSIYVSSKGNGENEEYENPEEIEFLIKSFVEFCVQKMLDDYDRQVFVREVLVSMIQNGSLSKDDLEFLARNLGFRGKPEKISDIERDWIKRKKIKEGEIYNHKNRIFAKLRNAFTAHPKWPDFAETLKDGRPVFF